MSSEASELERVKHRRIRRVKRWLRLLPRRSNIHRYPILNYFSEFARKRIYLWSFRVKNARSAIYLGSILTLMPLYGIQIPSAFFLALLFRANFPILGGLQLISNPLTVFFLWLMDYQVGRFVLSLFGASVPSINKGELRLMRDQLVQGNWWSQFENLSVIFLVTCLGAVILGLFCGIIGSVIYRMIAVRVAAGEVRLFQKVGFNQNEEKR